MAVLLLGSLYFATWKSLQVKEYVTGLSFSESSRCSLFFQGSWLVSKDWRLLEVVAVPTTELSKMPFIKRRCSRVYQGMNSREFVSAEAHRLTFTFKLKLLQQKGKMDRIMTFRSRIGTEKAETSRSQGFTDQLV